jgi:hypothetical protein
MNRERETACWQLISYIFISGERVLKIHCLKDHSTLSYSGQLCSKKILSGWTVDSEHSLHDAPIIQHILTPPQLIYLMYSSNQFIPKSTHSHPPTTAHFGHCSTLPCPALRLLSPPLLPNLAFIDLNLSWNCHFLRCTAFKRAMGMSSVKKVSWRGRMGAKTGFLF